MAGRKPGSLRPLIVPMERFDWRRHRSPPAAARSAYSPVDFEDLVLPKNFSVAMEIIPISGLSPLGRVVAARASFGGFVQHVPSPPDQLLPLRGGLMIHRTELPSLPIQSIKRTEMAWPNRQDVDFSWRRSTSVWGTMRDVPVALMRIRLPVGSRPVKVPWVGEPFGRVISTGPGW